MSTNDVPGYKSTNGDTLAMGCWAEKEDGSLIFVEANENGRVIYYIFDTAVSDGGPVIEYRDAMPEKEFKKVFSWHGDRSGLSDKLKGVPDIQWTWHDKTPFPWDRVIKKGARDGAGFASASDLMTAAAKVAESLGLRAQRFTKDHMASRSFGIGGMLRKLADALDNLDDRA